MSDGEARQTLASVSSTLPSIQHPPTAGVGRGSVPVCTARRVYAESWRMCPTLLLGMCTKLTSVHNKVVDVSTTLTNVPWKARQALVSVFNTLTSVPWEARQTPASVSNTLTSVSNTRRCRTEKRLRPGLRLLFRSPSARTPHSSSRLLSSPELSDAKVYEP